MATHCFICSDKKKKKWRHSSSSLSHTHNQVHQEILLVVPLKWIQDLTTSLHHYCHILIWVPSISALDPCDALLSGLFPSLLDYIPKQVYQILALLLKTLFYYLISLKIKAKTSLVFHAAQSTRVSLLLLDQARYIFILGHLQWSECSSPGYWPC